MPITLSLLAARQNPAQPTVVLWSGADPSAKELVLVVARRRLDATELDTALAGGHPEAQCLRFSASAGAVQDDVTAAGEPRYYGVVSALADGSFKPARFRAGPMAELPDGTLKLSALGGRPLAPATGAIAAPATGATAAPAPAASSAVRGPFAPSAPPSPAAPAPVTGSSAVRGPFAQSSPTPAPKPAMPTGSTALPIPAPTIDPLEARRQAQARAQAAAAASAPAPIPAPAVDPLEARRQAQARAQAAAGGEAPSTRAEPARRPSAKVAPPSEFPLDKFGLPMVGGTQSWDGLRVEWESEGKPAAAYEVFVSDHPISPDEVAEVVAGEGSGATVRAFPTSVKGVIDNVSPREQRAYYAVVARTERGRREPVGCVAQSVDNGGTRDLPFFDDTRLDDVRSDAQGQLREARVQLMIFKDDGDVSAWREALRLVGDALAIFPGLPAARELEAEIRAARAG